MPNAFCSPPPLLRAGDASLPIAKRLEDLVGRLSLDEKIGLMSADKHTHVSSCNMMSAGCLRLGIPSYMHLVETNTAVASKCLGPGKCSVNYPGPTGLGASFNRTLWSGKGHAMGEEMRAFNNLRWYQLEEYTLTCHILPLTPVLVHV